jgi:hypothetical protein
MTSRQFVVRAIAVIPVVVIGQQILRSRLDLGPDVSSLSAYVGAMSTLYSILTGFTVVTVWQQFSDTDRAVKREARNLRELWRYVGYVEDVEGVARARQAIAVYRDKVLTVEWPAMVGGRTASAADEEYFEMADAVNAMRVTTAKDVPAWAEAVRTLGEVGDARGERAVFVGVRMPALLRVLLYVATAGLILGMTLLPFASRITGALVATVTVLVTLLVLEIIDDLDDPFGGAWAISPGPLERIEFRRSEINVGA